MNYSELSDDKINLQVFERLFGNIGEDRDMLRVWQQGKFQPCNSWADARAIIQDNFISVNSSVHKDVWFADGMGERKTFETFDGNPLRAAMIVFLMMQETE